jgi:hypothetical protein
VAGSPDPTRGAGKAANSSPNGRKALGGAAGATGFADPTIAVVVSAPLKAAWDSARCYVVTSVRANDLNEGSSLGESVDPQARGEGSLQERDPWSPVASSGTAIGDVASTRRVDIELLRTLSALAVVAVHVGAIAGASAVGTPTYWMGLTLATAGIFAVPVFFAISGWVMFARSPVSSSSDLWRRIVRVGIPLIVWTVVYVLLDWQQGSGIRSAPLREPWWDTPPTHTFGSSTWGPSRSPVWVADGTYGGQSFAFETFATMPGRPCAQVWLE